MEITLDEIKAKTTKLGAAGIDARTIAADFEVRLGRALNAAEAGALQDGWRASSAARWERTQRQDRQAADQAAARRR